VTISKHKIFPACLQSNTSEWGAISAHEFPFCSLQLGMKQIANGDFFNVNLQSGHVQSEAARVRPCRIANLHHYCVTYSSTSEPALGDEHI
jgi:hypothetical protein